jgi:WD40 repeat protein/tetratricopeptide (TPR) repeat protein
VPLALPSKGYGLTASFSADGKLIFTTLIHRPVSTQKGAGGKGKSDASPRHYEAEARLWDADTGEALGPPMKHQLFASSGPGIGFELRHPQAAWSDDGARFICRPDVVKPLLEIRDPRTGQALARPLPIGPMMHEVQLSRDGRRLLTIGAAPVQLRLWNAETGVPLSRNLGELSRLLIYAATLSPTGDRLALEERKGPLGQQYSIIHVWDATTGAAVTRPLMHERTVSQVLFHPDNRRLVTACADGSARVWDLTTGEQVRVFRHDRAVEHVAFSADGRRLATFARTVGPFTSTLGHFQVWDADTGQALTLPLAAYSVGGIRFAGSAFAVSFDFPMSAQADRLVIHQVGASSYVYDLTADARPLVELEAEARRLSGRQITSGGNLQLQEPDSVLAAWRDHFARPSLASGDPALEGRAWHEQEAKRVTPLTTLVRVSAPPRGDLECRLWHLDRLVTAHPADANYRADRGMILNSLSRYSEALDDLNRAVGRADRRPRDLWLTRATVLASLGRYADAEKDFEKGLEEPDSVPAGPAGNVQSLEATVALLHLYRGDMAGYRKHVPSPLTILPKTAVKTKFVPILPIHVLSPTGLSNFQDPNLRAPAARAIGPGPVFAVAAALEYRRDNFAKAAELFERAIKTKPAAVAGDWFFLAMSQHKQGLTQEAGRSLAEGVKWMRKPGQPSDDEDAFGGFVPRSLVTAIGFAPSWQLPLMEQILRREAEGLILKK